MGKIQFVEQVELITIKTIEAVEKVLIFYNFNAYAGKSLFRLEK
jgi:hypothetical protein